MKYKEKSALCKCGNLRREGQRDCLKCHAKKMREARKATPEERIRRTLMSEIRKERGRKVPDEFREKLAVLAQKVARQIDEFNLSMSV